MGIAVPSHRRRSSRSRSRALFTHVRARARRRLVRRRPGGGRRTAPARPRRRPVDRAGSRRWLRAPLLARRQPRLDDPWTTSPARSPRRARTTTAGCRHGRPGRARRARLHDPAARLLRRAGRPTTRSTRRAPIYFIQGIWIPGEEDWYAQGDAYAPAVTDTFRAEIEDAVARRPRRRDTAAAARPRRRLLPLRRRALAAGLVARHRVGPARGREDRRAERRPRAATRAATSTPPTTRRRWRAGSRRCSTTSRRSTRSAAGAAR